MQEDGTPHILAVEYRGNIIRDLMRDVEVLLLDLNQDAKNPAMVWQFYKALRIGHGGKPSLDTDPTPMKQGNDRRGVRFRQIHRGIVWQFAPVGDGMASPLLIALDPSSCGHPDQRARTGAANGKNGCIHGRQAFPPILRAGVKVQFGCSAIDTGRAIQRHRFRRQRKSWMEISAACAVKTGLNDHMVSSPTERWPPYIRIGGQSNCFRRQTDGFRWGRSLQLPDQIERAVTVSVNRNSTVDSSRHTVPRQTLKPGEPKP